VCDPLAPFFRLPVSKLPSDAVAVCGAVSWLVQVTVSPTLTVTVAGLKAKPWIGTLNEPAARALGAARGALAGLVCSSAGPGSVAVAGCAVAGAGAAWAGSACAAGSGAGAGAGAGVV
jgi:hypothetical protein